MASPTSSSPPSASNSDHSAAPPTPPTPPRNQDVTSEIGVGDTFEEKPRILKEDEKPRLIDPFEDMDSREYRERFSKYEADYTHRLMAKYFSDKDIYGDSVFYVSMTIDGQTIKASRIHCAQSYADPVQYLKAKSISSPPSETQTSISNGKLPKEERETNSF